MLKLEKLTWLMVIFKHQELRSDSFKPFSHWLGQAQDGERPSEDLKSFSSYFIIMPTQYLIYGNNLAESSGESVVKMYMEA